MFESFLDDPREYAALEQLWEQLTRRLVGEFAAQPWLPWLRTTFADGTPMRDGDPICSFQSVDHRRAIRIVQAPSLSIRDVYFDRFGDETDVLVMRLGLQPSLFTDVSPVIAIWAREEQLERAKSLIEMVWTAQTTALQVTADVKWR